MPCHGDALPPGWWRTHPDLLRDEYEAHGSWANVRRSHPDNCCAEDNLAKWWHRHGLPPLQRGPKPAERPEATAVGDIDGRVLEIASSAREPLTVEQIADRADVAPRRVREAIARLSERGYRIEVAQGSRVVLTRVVPPSDFVHTATPELFDGELVRFAVVSDTHLGSKSCRLAELHCAYDIIAREGITVVYHPGDLVAGVGVYKHQARDLLVHTFDGQVEYAAENYPRRDGITTYIIGGNHDLAGDLGRHAADPVRAVCNMRPDMVHLGDYSAWVDLPNGGRLHLLHPGGGGAYALSYRPQRIAEAYEGGSKPSATLFGHWHRQGDFEHRAIRLLLCGTFEGATDLARRYGLGPPAIGFHTVEARMADDGSLVEWRAWWRPFYPGRVVTR
jgi:predicted phosphodiesterase